MTSQKSCSDSYPSSPFRLCMVASPSNSPSSSASTSSLSSLSSTYSLSLLLARPLRIQAAIHPYRTYHHHLPSPLRPLPSLPPLPPPPHPTLNWNHPPQWSECIKCYSRCHLHILILVKCPHCPACSPACLDIGWATLFVHQLDNWLSWTGIINDFIFTVCHISPISGLQLLEIFCTLFVHFRTFAFLC